jgi:hypothetical protein
MEIHAWLESFVPDPTHVGDRVGASLVVGAHVSPNLVGGLVPVGERVLEGELLFQNGSSAGMDEEYNVVEVIYIALEEPDPAVASSLLSWRNLLDWIVVHIQSKAVVNGSFVKSINSFGAALLRSTQLNWSGSLPPTICAHVHPTSTRTSEMWVAFREVATSRVIPDW